MNYDPKTFWDDAAQQMASRDDDVEIASDSTPFTRYKRECFVRGFLNEMPIVNRSILEVGCGPGGNLGELARRGGAAKLHGVDIAPNMVALAGRRLGDVATIDAASGDRLPFDDQAVDLSFISTVLMHNLEDPGAASMIAELCRVAKETVWLVEDTAARRRQRPHHVRRTPAWYTAQLERHGFRIDSIDHLPMLASRAVAGALARLTHRKNRGRGHRQPKWAKLVEGGLLPVTRRLDSVLPSRSVLTCIQATRI